MKPEIDPFHAVSVSRKARKMGRQGRSIIHMEFGQPSTGAPRAAIEAAHRILDTEAMGYWESDALCLRLSQHYRETYGLEIEPERFVFTCGASPALVLALTSTFAAGDRIAMARPGYVAYRNVVRALHMTPVEIQCGAQERFQLTARQLERLDPAPAGVIVASPANPTGTIITREEMNAIAEVCARRGIQIISDEIYHGLSYGAPASSMLEFSPEALVINSFSKYFSMVGWRLGWLLAPMDRAQRARNFTFNMFLTAPSLSQHAALAALDAREELNGYLETYARNRDLLLRTLPELGLDSIAPPDGAFYIYCDIGRFTNDSLGFCERMLEEIGVATAPGIDFDPVDGKRFIRLSFAISTPEIAEALARMKPWFKALA